MVTKAFWEPRSPRNPVTFDSAVKKQLESTFVENFVVTESRNNEYNNPLLRDYFTQGSYARLSGINI